MANEFILTGFFEETELGTNRVQHGLVFNHGMLRVPVPEESIRFLKRAMSSGSGIEDLPPAAAAVFQKYRTPEPVTNGFHGPTGEIYPDDLSDTDDSGNPQV